jgi:peptidoglycan/xylan/chitin deacetylase (PgdA/CDA1 family)
MINAIAPKGPTMSSRSRFYDVAIWTAGRMAAGLNRIFGDRPGDAFGILMYHRTTSLAGNSLPTWNVTPDQMRRQLAGLLSRGFEAWPLEKLIAAQRDGSGVPAGAFAVTFDDGHESNYAEAWPILRELGVPATIFLATKYLDSDRPFPFDDWQAAGSSCVPSGSWRPMTTSQCRELLSDGLISLGAHTHSHERFVGRGAAFRVDLDACLSVLRERFDIHNPAFALPYGASSDELIELARKASVTCCLSTRSRRVSYGDDPFTWGRFTVEPADSAAVLAAKLSGWYTTTAEASKTLVRPLVAVARTARSSRGLAVDGEVTKA